MRIGVFQFHGSGDVQSNCEAIKRAVEMASVEKVRLLVFQECALCGYPPVEVPSVKDIDFGQVESCLQQVCRFAERYSLYIALGLVREQDSRRYNSLMLISPDGGIVGTYDKRALWGWDVENFAAGHAQGIFQVDGIPVGFRICYEVRFPEYFRELFMARVPLCFVSFCDVSAGDSLERYDTIKAHLITRAVENVMTVVSVNSISRFQTAPTAVLDCNGRVVAEAPRNREYLLVYDFELPDLENDFGARGRMLHSNKLVNK